MRLLLLGTEGCHLCEEALEIVRGCAQEIAPFDIEPIDIAVHSEWQPAYALKIPVLLEPESGQELHWPFDHSQASHFLLRIDEKISR
jgi:hypothetical protein